MNFNENVFNEQIHAVRDFLFHYSSYRILHENFDALCKKGSMEFWAYTINAHYFQAINLWCMVFGANSNEIHWKNLGFDDGLTMQILAELDISQDDYKLYWDDVVDWRNMFSAHRMPNFRATTPVPELKMARTVVFIYEKWIRKQLSAIGIAYEISLERYEDYFCDEVKRSIKA